MKVICIDGFKAGEKSTIKNKIVRVEEEIYEGCAYVVIGTNNYLGEIFYFLQGKPQTTAYDSNLFVPLSDIDETQMEHKRQNKVTTILEEWIQII